MASHPSRQLLNDIEIFRSLSPRVRQGIAAEMTERRLLAGEVLFREGESDAHLYVIGAGVLEASKSVDSREVFLRTLNAGEVIGLTSLFTGKARSATVRARTDAVLWRLPHPRLLSRLREGDDAWEAVRSLLADFSERVRRKNREMAQLFGRASSQGRLRVAVFDSKSYTREIFESRNRYEYDLTFHEVRLGPETVLLAAGFPAVCVFVNDVLNGDVIRALRQAGVSLIALRSAGFNNVDLAACKEEGMSLVRVPAYSPHAVAEHAVALLLALNRRIHRAYNRVREGNFRLDGLVGFDLHGKTVGVVGTGRIGVEFARIMLGFGCRVLAYDQRENPGLRERGVSYVPLATLWREADVVSLHTPLNPETQHLVNGTVIDAMKPGVHIINTSRGGLVDTQALVEGLKSGQVGGAGLDVYEEEDRYFFEDYSGGVIADDLLARLLTFNNVIVTSHQAFLTHEALTAIADTTFASLREFEVGKRGRELTHSDFY